ncbi:Calcineurin-like phosphoesterase [uncultured archaeon]|nr:Calcineurin-like phosphoesterase [uncultured archaeon]
MISPLFGTPLLLVEGKERVMVASDLHLGLEFELMLCGVSIPSQTVRILERLQSFISEIKPDRLLLLGDIKHNVPRISWQEKREVPDFLSRLARLVPVEIIPGNHDAGVADMAPPGVRIRSASGFVRDGVGYFHGHTWPDEKILHAEILVAGHLHPALRLRDSLGPTPTRPVWARAAIKPEAAQQHYGFDCQKEIIIMPAFNELCGGLPLNLPCEDPRGPLLTLVDMDRARIYLLDGTDLGHLSEIKASQERQSGQQELLPGDGHLHF